MLSSRSRVNQTVGPSETRCGHRRRLYVRAELLFKTRNDTRNEISAHSGTVLPNAEGATAPPSVFSRKPPLPRCDFFSSGADRTHAPAARGICSYAAPLTPSAIAGAHFPVW